MTILVSIASYKDALLWNTVNDCISNASFPENLRFVIVDQIETPYDVKSHPNCNQITYFHFDPYLSRGPCWARNICHSLYNNEDYVLQIDAHMVFDKGWDVYLIDKLKECQSISNKCIISTYPQEFEIVDNTIKKNSKTEITTIIRPKEGSTITEEDPSFSFTGFNVKKEESVLGFHVAGGFIFAPGNFFQEIPYDPMLYFIGEEQNIAVRAWTNGWDIYHIPNVPIYHLYYTKTKRTLHWDKEEDKNRQTRWYELRDKSRSRLRDLFLYQKDLGAYSLGKTRTLIQFAEFSGINYIEKTIIFNHKF